MELSKGQIATIAVLLCTTFLVSLNTTLVSPALVVLMEDFSVNVTSAQFVMSVYSLTNAAVIPLSAYLLGRFTTRHLFFIGIAFFTIGSALCATAPLFVLLLLGRVMQAIASGVFVPMVFTMVVVIFPQARRGLGMGLAGLTLAFAPALGPVISGALLGAFSWRMLFVISGVIGTAIAAFGMALLRNYGTFERISFDVQSVVMSSIGLVCLLYGVSTCASSERIIVPIIFILVGAIACVLFVRRQLVLEAPLLDIRVLRVRDYRIMVIVGMMALGTIITMGTLMPLYIQGIRGFSALDSGLTMLPGALLNAVVGIFMGHLFGRIGIRRCVIPGGILFAIGALSLNALGLEADLPMIAGSYLVMLLGFSLVNTPLSTWGINALDASLIQHANSLTNTLNQVATSLLTAAVVSASTLGWMVVPESDVLMRAYAGNQLAFAAVTIVVLIAVAVMFACVRERISEPSKTASFLLETLPSEHGADALPINLVMNRTPYYACVNDTVKVVCEALVRYKTSSLPIVDESMEVVGVVSDGDIMKHIAAHENILDQSFTIFLIPDIEPYEQRVEELMKMNVMQVATKRVVALEGTTTLENACAVFIGRRFKKVPVTENGKLVGTLSRSDVLRKTMSALVSV